MEHTALTASCTTVFSGIESLIAYVVYFQMRARVGEEPFFFFCTFAPFLVSVIAGEIKRESRCNCLVTSHSLPDSELAQ